MSEDRETMSRLRWLMRGYAGPSGWSMVYGKGPGEEVRGEW